MATDNKIEQLENENKQLRQLLSDALKAISMLDEVAKQYKKIADVKDTKIFDNDENVKNLLKKYSRL